MKNRCIVFIAVILAAALLTAGCVQADTQIPALTATNSVPAHTSEELVAFAGEAFDYAGMHGKEAAIREFNDPNGNFSDPGMYIIASDFNGTILAHPYQPDHIGTNQLNLTYEEGAAFIRDAIGEAENGSGFIYYLYPNPAENQTVMLKTGYVRTVDETWWLMTGAYISLNGTSVAK